MTGRSTPATPARLKQLILKSKGHPDTNCPNHCRYAMQFLVNCRADSIAADVEAIRQYFCGPDGKISLIGQSYGGFIMLTYLSRWSDKVQRCMFTCGLAPILRQADEVYEATIKRMLHRNKQFYNRYKGDVEKVREIVHYLENLETNSENSCPLLPSGGRLTVRRFLMLGLMLGSGNGMENLHWLLENAFEVQGDLTSLTGSEEQTEKQLSTVFLHAIDAQQNAFETNPIYWLLHESIYCNGSGQESNWSAHRKINANTQFCAQKILQGNSEEEGYQYTPQPINFTGEMVFPWMSEDFSGLCDLGDLAENLAQMHWGRDLYNFENLENVAQKVDIAALVSYDDIYVERTFSEETAELLGKYDCKLWITNEFQHSGLRDDGEKVFETLLKMCNGEVSIPS